MKKEKWLNNFIFDTTLIDNTFLSETERFSLKSYLHDHRTLAQIGLEIEVSDERVRQLIENGIGKIFLHTKDLIARSFWLNKTLTEKDLLQKELESLKFKFKKELASEKQLTILFEENDMPISIIPLSVRAKKVLTELNINTVNQLGTLTKDKLYSIEKTGVKTVDEIIRRAEEIGIKIT